jgi:hypothetical protein
MSNNNGSKKIQFTGKTVGVVIFKNLIMKKYYL